jgi:16S rRNA (adenine1518-N6/adenine1519-N6)-dimethyltransferase
VQTKQDIERLLAGVGASPNRRLGQNFLIDMNLMKLLIDEARIHRNDTVLEVGTGTGSMTEELSQRAGRVITVEYDSALARAAGAQLGKLSNITLFNMDVLENKNAIHAEILDACVKSRQVLGGHLLLVANLPYNIGSSVMANLITGPVVADTMTVTVQKEVAERMTAAAGSDDYGPLSILMHATGSAHIFRKLPPSVFWPRPQVDSAMVSFTRDIQKTSQIHDMKIFHQVIALFMNHRRKMLKACVKFADGDLAHVHGWAEIFAEAFVEPHHRPEELAAADYINIANLCHQQIT